ncbi:MAG: D-aminoacylase [Clostridia bacterium]|nr:D-aminoacylase [Clostridia bacterium]
MGVIMLDILIKSGTVYDGSGKPGICRDVGVKDGKIVFPDSGAEVESKEVIDAKGFAVTPGFIDAHTHADEQIYGEPSRASKLLQGNTTEVAGQCSFSRAPYLPDAPFDSEETRLRIALEPTYPSYAEYRKDMESREYGTNILSFVGHRSIRASVLGMENRPATSRELDRMKGLLAECMESGAPGMSTGLVYAPSCYAPEEELVELLRVVAKYGGMYTTHIRGEADTVVEALEEALRIGNAAGVPVNISHLKAMFPQNYHKVDVMLEMIDNAVAKGQDVTFDAYPYDATSSPATSALPPSFLAKGITAVSDFLGTKEGVAALRKAVTNQTEVWENPIKNIGAGNFIITDASVTTEAIGKRVSEYAAMKGLDEIEAFADLFHRNRCDMTDVRFNMLEENIEKIYRHSLCLVGSDGLYTGGAALAHPRAFATFPRYLGRFIREKKILPLAEGIRRITGQAADRYRLGGRGYIREGYVADITVFDPETVIDRATYEDPFLPNAGISCVIVGGVIRARNGELINCENGKFLTWR